MEELVAGRSPLSSLISGFGPDMAPPAPFLQRKPHLSLGGSRVLADPA